MGNETPFNPLIIGAAQHVRSVLSAERASRDLTQAAREACRDAMACGGLSDPSFARCGGADFSCPCQNGQDAHPCQFQGLLLAAGSLGPVLTGVLRLLFRLGNPATHNHSLVDLPGIFINCRCEHSRRRRRALLRTAS
jgi:hypothetical protein